MNSTPLTTVLAAALGLALLGGCAEETTVADTTTPVVDDDLASPVATAPVTQPDLPLGTDPATTAIATDMQSDDVLGVVMVVDQNEIQAAEHARGKNVEGEVREYADTIHRDHTANLERTQQAMSGMGADNDGTAAAGENPLVETQRQKGQQTLQRLEILQGEAYAAGYVDAMVDAHQATLSMIDNELIAAVQDEQVRDHLTQTRAVIARHLEMGRELQAAARTAQ